MCVYEHLTLVNMIYDRCSGVLFAAVIRRDDSAKQKINASVHGGVLTNVGNLQELKHRHVSARNIDKVEVEVKLFPRTSIIGVDIWMLKT